MSDAYALALQSRRGEGLDTSLLSQPSDAAAPPAPLPPPAAVSQPPTPPQAQDMSAEIASHVTGGANEHEYEMLKGMKPRSLGERAKMDALRTQFKDKK